MGENEQQPILRSINNNQRSFVRFFNTTAHNVGIYWIDYQGQAVSYGVLGRHGRIDINTFVTHPWIFVDEETRERYTVNQKDVFFPEPWYVKYIGVRPEDLPPRVERTLVLITLPIYTLRELSLMVIKRRLKYDQQAFKLNIPRSLQHELAKMLPRKSDVQDES